MKNIMLIGYYGFKNFGDDLLLKSILKIFQEINFSGNIYIPSDNELPINKTSYSFSIKNINRFDILSLRSYVQKMDIVIYGGGNLFQSETSLKSFLYYYYIAKTAMKNNIKILLLSQGLGPIKHKIASKMLKKVLSYKNLQAIFRDNTSYNFAKNYNHNVYLSADLGLYCLMDEQENFIKKDKKNKISICLKNNYNDIESLIDFLSIFNDHEIQTLIINSDKDSSVNYYIVDKMRENKVNIPFPLKDFNKIIEEISTSNLIISDRLHGAIAGIFFGVPTFTYGNNKNQRVLKNISSDYKFFYKELIDISSLYTDYITKGYDFKTLGERFNIDILNSVKITKELIQNAL
ncbi:polysaccharide pyruvyl transferase family protein [Oceanotoga sp. DSM 15011]|jgi:polysaccharide pyruvyl transferase CsaB|uniref:Polysaccharide pyruvyl transferase CsaB n=1 Tax=Oceanotoga teriensis TaxID=515440 RepID=A0AA45HJM0_9BACT|nr:MULTISPECIES: polysaccharide pyruvyl transferase family protein [Oceanotoga]MDN5342057.1 hypothetical protein [Oceanotoga sp.]PWJ96239.1 polysaccharide pyruvyl transferase CsaB [Oceanotoga teriensis]UYP00023.1 polysaccharide pyruvyl transferase family protein [Oceanotoga sp. DSM 15011]